MNKLLSDRKKNFIIYQNAFNNEIYKGTSQNLSIFEGPPELNL